MAAPLLRATDLHTLLGASHVLQGIGLEVAEGEIVCLLGRNGAGKTTTLRTLMGLARPGAGAVAFLDRDITGLPPHGRAAAGIAYVPQDRRLFRSLSVEENLTVAASATAGRAGRWTLEAAYAWFPKLAERRDQQSSRLSGGEQRMLAIARALVTNPRLILLDEPTDGLAPVIVEQLLDLIQRITREDIAILLAEQNVRFASALADRGYVIDKGRIREEGPIDRLLADKDFLARHLGV